MELSSLRLFGQILLAIGFVGCFYWRLREFVGSRLLKAGPEEVGKHLSRALGSAIGYTLLGYATLAAFGPWIGHIGVMMISVVSESLATKAVETLFGQI